MSLYKHHASSSFSGLALIFFFLQFSIWQGKKEEGRVHFERVANMEEPEDPTSKGYYFDGLLLLARYNMVKYLD